MKRQAFDEFLVKQKRLRTDCMNNFNKFKKISSHLRYDVKRDAFFDKERDEVKAYRLNGIM
jgi:hypothetical protein